jgi:hypothetical protein
MLSIYPDTIAASAGWKERASSSAPTKVKLAPPPASFRKGNRFIKIPLPPLAGDGDRDVWRVHRLDFISLDCDRANARRVVDFQPGGSAAFGILQAK